MKTIACVNNSVVENVIAAESEYSVEVLKHLLPGVELFVEVTEETGFPFVGHLHFSGLNKFQPMKPYDSWTWDLEAFAWLPPVARPVEEGKFFDWDEESLSWVEIPLPELTDQPDDS